MFSAVLTIVMIALAGGAGNSPLLQAGNAHSPDEAELIRLERVWNEAHVNGDADALDRLWAEDLTVTVPNMQVITKQSAIAIARSGRMKFKRYETSDVRVRLYGDAAVLTGIVERTRVLNGQEVNDKWRFTKMYIRRAGKWQVVAWHASIAADQ